MSVRFPVKTQLALGADLTADPATWVLTDITTKTYVRDGGIGIRRGRQDWLAGASPGAIGALLNNRDGRFSRLNPTGTYFGTLAKNTPLVVSIDAGAGYVVRSTAYLSELPTQWDLSETDFRTPVRADGILRRLQQGTSPTRSALARTIPASDPVAYWPLEDGASSNQFASGLAGGAPLSVVGAPSRAAVTAMAGSAPIAEFDTASSYGAAAITGASTGQLVVSMIDQGSMASTPHPVIYTPFAVQFSDGTVTDFRAVAYAGYSGGAFTSTVGIDVQVNLVGVVSTFGTGFNPFDGTGHYVSAVVSQNGADVDVELWVDGVLVDSGTAAALTLGVPSQLNPPIFSPGSLDAITVDNTGAHFALGHTSIHDTAVDPAGLGEAALGYLGELAGDRFSRLCTEEGIFADVTAGSTQAMGPQPVGKLLDLLRECEAAEAGLIVERRDGSLGFDPVSSRYNVAVALALDYSQRLITEPFGPVDDDQLTRNDVTVTRPGGSSARAVDIDGPLGIDTVGRYDTELSINMATDRGAYEQAGWQLNLGTVNEYRWPVVTLKLHSPTLASLRTSIAALDIGSRVTIDNLPATLPPDLVDLVVEGINEQFTNYEWTVQLLCQPYRPYRVFEMADTTADQNPYLGRLAGDPNAATRADITSSATSIDIDPNWTRFTTDADDFDPDLEFRLGGEVIAVSSIATTAATYVGRGALASADNAAVSPTTTGFGAADGDLLCCLGRIRGTAGSLSASAGWDLMGQVGNLYLWGQVRSGTTPITLTPSGGAAGDTVSGTVFALRNMPITVDPSDLVLEVLPQINGSAQGIAFPGILPFNPGTVVFLLAGKSDDWTSVAVPAGYTESGEPSTTTGNDQGLYLAYQIQTTPALVEGGTALVTGGAAAVSEAMVISLAAGYQTLTVSARSVNGAIKAQPAGTRIEVEDAVPIAL